MACVRKRRGKWVVDYRDAAGVRRWVTCETRREAEDVRDSKRREARQATRPVVDPDITVIAYAERWLGLLAVGVKPRTLTMYRSYLNLHLLPVFGATKVRQLAKGRIKELLAQKVRIGFSRASVELMLAVLRGMLNAAIEDGVILANPTDRVARQLRLSHAASARQDEIKAMTREQLARFVAAASQAVPRTFPLFLLLARTGMRLGEALALQWQDLNFAEREIRVARALGAAGRIDTPKSGRGRTVDVSQELVRTLRRLELERKTETLKCGWSALPLWVFCDSTGRPLSPRTVEDAFKRVLKAAGLPPHFSPHSLRHSFASLLLQQGESPVYVQRQLGHASITLTVDLYGRWLPMGNKAAVDRLDGPSGSKTVAETVAGGARAPEKHKESRGSIAGSGRARIIAP